MDFEVLFRAAVFFGLLSGLRSQVWGNIKEGRKLEARTSLQLWGRESVRSSAGGSNLVNK